MIYDVSSQCFVCKWKEVSEHDESFIIDEFGLFADLVVIDHSEATVDQEILHLAKICAVLLQTLEDVGDRSVTCCGIVQGSFSYLFGTVGKKVEVLMMDFLQPSKDNGEELYYLTP